MPPYIWTTPITVARTQLEADGYPNASALLTHSVWAVDALHYQVDLDTAAQLHGHSAATADIAHARWSAGTGLTSLDLCAAVLDRRHVRRNDGVVAIESTIRSFNPSSQRHAVANAGRLAALPTQARAWIIGIQAEADYGALLALRNPLVHARAFRHFSTAADRTMYDFAGDRIEVPAILARVTNLTTRYVERFLADVEFV